MYKIIFAMIKINIDDYIEGLKSHYGYIDGSCYSIEPSTELIASNFKNLVDAENEINRAVNISINGNDVFIEYEYIRGSENVYFEKVAFKGVTYPLTNDMYSPKCYEAIMNFLTK